MAKQASLLNLSTYHSAPQFSFSHDGIGKERVKAGPAPGTYNVVSVDKDKFSKSASYSILGASKVGGAVSTGFSKNPGPGAYVPNGTIRSMSAPRWAFGSETRMADIKRMQAPGPGAYDTRTPNDAKHISISSKFDYTKKEQSPAPGAYMPKFEAQSTMRAAERMTFGSSSRTGFRDNLVPGPGKYDMGTKAVSMGYKTAPAFSIRPRWKDPVIKNSGPGFMSQTTGFGKK